MKRDDLLEQISLKYMDHTMKQRNWDGYDFFETSVWSVRDALNAAFEAGRQAEKRNAKNRERRATQKQNKGK